MQNWQVNSRSISFKGSTYQLNVVLPAELVDWAERERERGTEAGNGQTQNRIVVSGAGTITHLL